MEQLGGDDAEHLGQRRDGRSVSFCDVRAEHITYLWPQAEPLIAKVLAREPLQRWKTEDLLPLLLDHRLRLWVAWNHDTESIDAVVVTEVVDYPRMKEFRIWLVGGKNMKAWIKEAIASLEGFAAYLGCGVVTGYSRKGWLRVGSGYRETGIMFEKAL